MPTQWFYDPEICAADIALRPDSWPVAYPIRTIDLAGAHILLDVDKDGTVLNIEILGPAAGFPLENLMDYLLSPANITDLVPDPGPGPAGQPFTDDENEEHHGQP